MNTSKITAVMFSAATVSFFFADFYLLKESRMKAGDKHVTVTSVAGIAPASVTDPMPLTETTPEENTEEDVFKRENGIITFNSSNTTGLVYRIQVLSSKTQVPLFSSSFKGLEDVREYYTKDGYIYTIGTFASPGQAEPLSVKLDDQGYPYHCLVAFKDDKPLRIKDALKDVVK
jgi:hypothetical protein